MTKIVAIDAGHGINTPGKRTPDDEREWSFNSIVAQSIIENLKNYNGIKTVRLDDPTGKRDVPLRERTNKANNANADILISFHHNAFKSIWGTHGGTETYHYPGSAKGKQLAQAIHPSIVKAYGLRDRGIKSANFHMLRESNMPAILIEGGFMDSTVDIKKLRDKNVLEQAGKNIADAIANYFNLNKKAGKSATSKASTKTSGKSNTKSTSTYQGSSIVDYLKSIGQPSSIAHRRKLAKQYGIKGYVGTASQNTRLLNAMRGNKTSTTTKTTTTKQYTPKSFRVGQKVKIKSSAKKYSRSNVTIPTKYKNKSYTIQQVGKDDVLLKELYSWVKKKDTY